jgi:hypothetical protein
MRELLEHHPFDSVDIIRRLLDKKTFDQRQTVASLDGVDWELLRDQKLTLIAIYQQHLIKKNGLRTENILDIEAALSGIVHLVDNIQDQAAKQLGQEAVFGEPWA